jgi:hypothetical protein
LFFPVFYIVKRDERDRLAVRFADWPIGRALVRGVGWFCGRVRGGGPCLPVRHRCASGCVTVMPDGLHGCRCWWDGGSGAVGRRRWIVLQAVGLPAGGWPVGRACAFWAKALACGVRIPVPCPVFRWQCLLWPVRGSVAVLPHGCPVGVSDDDVGRN